LYSGNAQFRSQLGHQLSRLSFSQCSSVPTGKYWDSILIRPWQLPSKFFPIHYSPIILSFSAVYSEVMTVS
jgi:hypothetical protein